MLNSSAKKVFRSVLHRHLDIWTSLLFLSLVIGTLSCGSNGSGGTNNGTGDSSAPGEEGGQGANIDDIDGPVDIPLPVAKTIDGIDSTTVQFRDVGETGSLTKKGKVRQVGTGQTIGTLLASTLNKEDGEVGLIENGGFLTTQSTTEGAIEFDLAESLQDSTLAMVVVGSGENEGSISPPVIIRISDPSRPKVAITNLGGIQNEVPAISGEEVVAFPARDNTDIAYVGSVPFRGGSASVFSSETSQILTQLQFRSDGTLIGIAESTAKFYFVAADGSIDVETTDPGDLTAEERYFTRS